MQRFGVKILDGYTSGAPAPSALVQYPGGRGALVITATGYPAAVTLQYKARSGVFIDITPANADGIYVFDFPAGEYRLNMAGGAAANVNADLVSIPSG